MPPDLDEDDDPLITYRRPRRTIAICIGCIALGTITVLTSHRASGWQAVAATVVLSAMFIMVIALPDLRDRGLRKLALRRLQTGKAMADRAVMSEALLASPYSGQALVLRQSLHRAAIRSMPAIIIFGGASYAARRAQGEPNADLVMWTTGIAACFMAVTLGVTVARGGSSIRFDSAGFRIAGPFMRSRFIAWDELTGLRVDRDIDAGQKARERLWYIRVMPDGRVDEKPLITKAVDLAPEQLRDLLNLWHDQFSKCTLMTF